MDTTTVTLQTHGKPRLHGLDYLRGFAAFGIMVYHYSSWTFGEQPANSFLGRLGIYGVAIFYVLSGQALTYVYASTLSFRPSTLREFYKKRIFRIFPLLWLATFLSIILSKHLPNFLNLALNLTGLFGLIKWDTYFATGAWSIGNELTFYLTFPVLIYSFNNRYRLLLFFILSICFLFIYFAFKKIQIDVPLGSQWHYYTNPLNQFAFFLGGALIGKFVNPADVKASYSLLTGAIGSAIFIFVPTSANVTELVTNWQRLIFATSCLLICYSFFRTARATSVFNGPLTTLGDMSYSLYLLHPIVYAVVKACFSMLAKRGLSHSDSSTVLIAGAFSLLMSYVSYHYLEKYFIKLNRKRKELITAQ